MLSDLTYAPICLVQYDNLMPPWWECHLLLCEALDLLADDINSSVFLLSLNDVNFAAMSTHLSSDAFNSNTPSLYASPRSWCARQCMLVVFPIPGIPCRWLEPVGKR